MGRDCVKTHYFQKMKKYLPLKQMSSCLSLLHMKHYGNSVPVNVSIPHFFKNHVLFLHSPDINYFLDSGFCKNFQV
jgi:hypothetical protein